MKIEETWKTAAVSATARHLMYVVPDVLESSRDAVRYANTLPVIPMTATAKVTALTAMIPV